MTANTGTLLVAPRWIEGQICFSLGKVTFTGTLTTGDTGTIPGMLPAINGYTLLHTVVWGTEFDSNASPTATIVIGDGTTTNLFLTSKTAGDATGQMQFWGDGAAFGASSGVTAASADTVITAGGTVATGSSGAVVWVQHAYVCNDAQN